MFRQAQRLVAARCPAALVLEGRSSDLRDCGVSREALQGALVSVSLIFGLPVVRTLDTAETARLIRYAALQMQRHVRGTLPRPGWRPRGRRRRQLFIVQGLPGIGPHRAARLLDRFGSVAAVFSASPEQLEQVEGLGPATVGRIAAILA